jgi:soluble lytic murein transglycosylase-like protein
LLRKTIVVMTMVSVIAACPGTRPAKADPTVVVPSATPVKSVRPEADLPAVLSARDAGLYRLMFASIAAGNWAEVDRLTSLVDDPLLLGHVLALRGLGAGGYRASPEELAAWLARYPDHPEAAQIASLLRSKARKRGRTPPAVSIEAPRVVEAIGEAMPPLALREARDEDASAFDALQLASEIRALLETGAISAAQRALASPRAQRLLSVEDAATLVSEIGASLLDDSGCGGSDDGCRFQGNAADAAWWAGLTAWRNGDYAAATQHFELVAARAERLPWLASAGAFWAARGHLLTQEPQNVTKWLTAAAAFPRTFYGLLARRILGLPMAFEWALTERDRKAVMALVALDAGRRALALIQVGQNDRAAMVLRALATAASGEILHGIMVAADRSGAAQLALQLEYRLYPRGGYDSAAYPIPYWTPDGGFTADRALIYAVIRQESRFNPRAVSRAGARGVMQLMPGTAHFVARRLGSGDAHRWADPEVNIKLGQHYIDVLMNDPNVAGDLFRFSVAWNGGPGNLDRWQRGAADTDDPLLFIEQIPARETRDFIERVLANLWIYRDRLGQSDPSLDALAAGEWPTYVALDARGFEIARRQED